MNLKLFMFSICLKVLFLKPDPSHHSLLLFPPSDVMLYLFHNVVKYHLRNLAIQFLGANSKIHNLLLLAFVKVSDKEYPNCN